MQVEGRGKVLSNTAKGRIVLRNSNEKVLERKHGQWIQVDIIGSGYSEVGGLGLS
jgi:hypothetical protein